MSPQRTPAAGRFLPNRRSGGFTMVELVIVIMLIGILGAIGAGRFFERTSFDATATTEQTRGMLRYAQKLAIAQRRPVYVYANSQGAFLCYAAGSTCGSNDRVPAPGGSNSGSAATAGFCTVAGAFGGNWFCEGVTRGVTLALSAGTSANFYFDGLGRPYQAGDAGADSTFTTLTLTIGGDGLNRTISVSPETGYVY